MYSTAIYVCVHVCVCLRAQSCPTVCNTMDCSPPGSSVHGIFQARILEWVAISYSRGSFWTRIWIHVSCVFYIGRDSLYYCTTLVRYIYIYIYIYKMYVCIYTCWGGFVGGQMAMVLPGAQIHSTQVGLWTDKVELAVPPLLFELLKRGLWQV